MRHKVLDASEVHVDDDLLTTGEAARILNSSRQHVVDLCEKGFLDFTTIGCHRRVRRADIEAIRARTERLTSDQRRSLLLAYAVAGRIVADPEGSRSLARRNLERMAPIARGEAREWLRVWERLLDGPIDELLEQLTSRTLRGRELRQNLPFAGVIPQDERTLMLRRWSEADRKRNDEVHGIEP